MSELLNARQPRDNFRHKLLTNVSILALVGYLGAVQGAALAADDDPPTVWIELGAQFERADSAHEIFAPPFVAKSPKADIDPMITAQNTPPFSIGGNAKITFVPHDTNWVLSASILYGRSNSGRQLQHQTQLPYVKQIFLSSIEPQPGRDNFGDGDGAFKESHAILDFRAGKDVGVGLFGAGGTSIVSAGVRFAQFTSSSSITLHARPDYRFGAVHHGSKIHHTYYGATKIFRYQTYDVFRNTYNASLQARRDTHAFGPSISWDASLPVVGNKQDMILTADWGVNAAFLFGRQRAHVNHQTGGYYFGKTGGEFKYQHQKHSSYAHGPYERTRSRAVTIPNVGGFVGGTLKFVNARISLGYRADFFFGAIDGGIDIRKSENVGFYGPFATINFGIGG
jgi:hypothetical protein